MAVDGSIIIDTKIDTEGVDKGNQKISSKVLGLKSKISATENAVARLTKELENMADTNIKSKTVEKLEKDVEKAKSKLNSLYEDADNIADKKYKDLSDMGFSDKNMHFDDVLSQDSEWQKIQSDIAAAEKQLHSYQSQLKSAQNAESGISGKDTAQYQEKKDKLTKLSNELDVYKAKLRETEAAEKKQSGETKKASKIMSLFKSGISKVGKGLKKAFSATVSKSIQGLSKSFNKVRKSIGRVFNNLKQAVGNLIIYKGLMSIFESAKVGIQNLAKASPGLNQSLSGVMSSLTRLKNSFATAFAPILNVVAPILTKFIDMLSGVADKVAQFTSALTGQSTYTKAVAVQEDYASSIEDTTKATESNTEANEENQKSLAGFDELNVMQDNSSSKSESAGLSAGDMFTESDIDGEIGGFAQKIKNLFKQGSFKDIGILIGEGLNSGVQKVKDFITGHDWAGMAASFAEGLNGLVEGVDWANLASTLSVGLTTLLSTVKTFLTTFEFGNLGTKIAQFVNNIDIVGILGEIGGTISALITGILDFLIGFIEGTDWSEFVSKLVDGIVNFIKNVDWGGVVSKIFRLIGGALGGLSQIIWTLLKKIWELLKQGWNSLKGYFSEKISEAGGNVFEGLLNGIVEGFKNIGTWIYENIFTPFIEGFKNAFGIHSPSTIMAEMGDFLIQGLLGGLTEMWSNITEFFSEKLTAIKEKFTQIVTEIGTFFSSAWTKVTGAFSLIKDWFSEKFTEAWEAVKSVFSLDNVSEFFSSVWTGIVEIFGGIKDWFSEKFSDAWEAICEVWEGATEWFSELFSGIWDGIRGIINDYILAGIESFVNFIIDGINGTISTLSDAIAGFGELFGQDWNINLNIAPVTIDRIPALATGTVVPANYGNFLAVLGDNKREPEVVSPLSTIKQALREVMDEFGDNDDRNITFIAELDGEVVFKKTVKRNNDWKKRYGKSAFD